MWHIGDWGTLMAVCTSILRHPSFWRSFAVVLLLVYELTRLFGILVFMNQKSEVHVKQCISIVEP